MKKEIDNFRAEIKSIFKPVVNLTLGTILIFLIAILVKEKFVFTLKILEAAGILGSVLLAILSILLLITTFTYRIKIFKDGISSYDPWGSYKCDFMNWAQMGSVVHKGVFGFKYYLIISKDQKESLWIPFYIKEKSVFIKTVTSLVEKEHNLLIELNKSET